MAAIGDVKTLLDAYGVGVRAGLITPQVDDEVYFREVLGLPEMSQAVRSDWETTGGVRKPITLAQEGDGGALIQADK